MDFDNISRRVAVRYFEARYAKLILSMSMSEAKEILGFPPNAQPSVSEVTKAYRTKAFENHPDRGGDPKKMVDVNVAKDILMGVRPPEGARWNPPTPPKQQYKPPPPPPPVEGKSFSQVLSSMPSGVDWKFISGSAYNNVVKTRDGEPNYMRHYHGWVLYGQTESNHVFAGIQSESNFSDRIEKYAVWDGFSTSAPRNVDLLKLAPKMVASIIRGFAGLENASKYAMPKKYKVLDGNITIKDLMSRADLSLKDAIIGSGALPAGSPGLKGRKKMVTVEPIFNREVWKKIKTEEGRVLGGDYRAFTWVVEVNGKGRTLEEDELERLKKNYFLFSIYGYDFTKGKKNLSRLRGRMFGAGAAKALTLLHEALNNGALKQEVGEAAEQMAASKKVACELANHLPMQHVAMLLDEPLLEVYGVVNG